MIINSSIMIFICFKEIFSWNCATSILFLTVLLFEKPNMSSQLYLKERSLNGTFENDSSIKSEQNLNHTLVDNHFNSTRNTTLLNKPISTTNNSSILKSTNATFKSLDHNFLSVSNQNLSTTNATTMRAITTIAKDLKKSNSTQHNTTIDENLTTTPVVLLNFITVSTSSSILSPSQNTTNVPINSKNIILTTVPVIPSTTSSPIDENGGLHPFHYILIVCAVIIVLLLIAYGIYHMYRKEQVRRLRIQLMPVYNFDPTESDDWENNLLEEEFTLRSRDKDKTTVTTAGATIDISEIVSPGDGESEVPVTHL